MHPLRPTEAGCHRPLAATAASRIREGGEGPGIAIVGAGVSGLTSGCSCTTMPPGDDLHGTTPEQVTGGRLLNTVAHHHHTLERERALGVHHWDAGNTATSATITARRHPRADAVPRRLRAPVLDHRLPPLPAAPDGRLRGARRRARSARPGDAPTPRVDHDLVVVAAGRGYRAVFTRRPRSPRRGARSGGCRRGSTTASPTASPRASACTSRSATASCSSCRSSRARASLPRCCSRRSPAATSRRSPSLLRDDPAAFHRAVSIGSSAISRCSLERSTCGSFALAGPGDILQGALTPAVSEDWCA